MIDFKVKFIFKDDDMQQVMKVRKLLSKYNFEVSVIVQKQQPYSHREKRLNFILKHLQTKSEPIRISTLYKYLSRHLTGSYRTLQRDIAILVLQGKINIFEVNNKESRGRTTLIQAKWRLSGFNRMCNNNCYNYLDICF